MSVPPQGWSLDSLMSTHIAIALSLVLGLVASVCGAPPVPVDASDRDSSNPRNVRWSGPVIEWVGITPRALVRELGDKPRAPEAEEARLEIVLRNAGDKDTGIMLILGLPDLPEGLPVASMAPAQRQTVEVALKTADIPYGKTLTLVGAVDSPAATPPVHDQFQMHGPGAHRIALVASEESWNDGDQRFGSMVRRFRKSLEDLEMLYDVQEVPGIPMGDESRPVITDRFRVEHVETFDPAAGTPALFAAHPEFDLVIAVNEGGPLCCFWLNDGDSLNYHSIGHNFLSDGGAEKRGIWSNWGEQALWHEIFHYRGVPDYYIYNVPPGSLPGRSPEGWKLGSSPGTAYLSREIMNDTYTAPEVSWLSATIANSKQGAARVGACENPEQPFGHMWQWVPKVLTVQVEPGEGAQVQAVRVYRAKPGQGRDGRVQRVTEDAEPIAAAAGASVSLEGDYMNSKGRRNERALWLLVEADLMTPTGIEQRWTIVTLLEMNEAFARGSQDAWTFRATASDLRKAE